MCALASPPGAPLDRAGESGYQGDWAASPMIRLYITPDDQQPYLLSFERAHINVGSAEANDVRLQAPGISSRHFRLRSVGSEVVLEDGGSRNGTYVNGVKVTGSQVLSPADVIRIVGFRIKILQPEAGVAATPETVKKYVGLGASVAVEAGAGEGASIADADYEAAGARLGSRADLRAGLRHRHAAVAGDPLRQDADAAGDIRTNSAAGLAWRPFLLRIWTERSGISRSPR